MFILQISITAAGILERNATIYSENKKQYNLLVSKLEEAVQTYSLSILVMLPSLYRVRSWNPVKVPF